MVLRTLRKHGYPPDKQKKATQTVLEQAELMVEGHTECTTVPHFARNSPNRGCSIHHGRILRMGYEMSKV